MVTKIYNKLIRDKIPEITRANGGVPVTRRIEGAEFKTALQKKLREEVDEVLAAATPEEIIAELADCLEVIETLSKEMGYSIEQLQMQKELKRTQKGGFDQKIFLERVE